ncbi:MAG: RNA pseudouridine synthase, partial [Bacteroidota bacterium]
MASKTTYLHFFKEDISGIPLPKRFTYPFNYQVHELCELAIQAIQQRLLTEVIPHNFGINDYKIGKPLGKMFGVLVVKNLDDRLGYLAAFSGRLGTSNHFPGFVPPVFDTLHPEGFFVEAEAYLNKVNSKIKELEASKPYQKLLAHLSELRTTAETAIQQSKAELKIHKQLRNQKRAEARNKLAVENYQDLAETLKQESLQQQYAHKDLKRHWKRTIAEIETELQPYEQELSQLKQERKALSNATQDRIFESYQFLNARAEWRSLKSIFGQFPPPSGAGECAAPRLLQYAYEHDLRPIAMAEFWWGASPLSEVRHHQQHYPACRGK